MPLDPRIALGVQAPQARSPLQSLGNIAQLRDAEEQNSQRRMENEQRRRGLDDDTAIRAALQQHDSPDKAMEVLYKQGRAGAAGLLAKQVFEERKSRAAQEKEELANTASRLDYAGRIAQGIVDEASHQNARRAIGALLRPEAGAALGETYNPDRVKQALAWGTERKDVP
jgi:hypothetical protein